VNRPVLIALCVALVAGGVGVLARWSRESTPTVATPPAPESINEHDSMVRAAVEEALADVHEAPADPAPRATLGMIYHAHDLYQPAVEAYEQALQLDESNAKVWYLLTDALARQGRLDAARTAFDELFQHDDAYGPAWIAFGQLLLERNEPDAARDAFRRARELQPGNVGAIVGLARVALVQRRNQDAADTLQRLVRENVNLPYVHHLLGIALQRLGHTEQAALHAARSDGKPPSWNDPWYESMRRLRTGFRARMEEAAQLIASGRSGDAIRMLTRLRSSFPTDVTLLNYLALAHDASGKRRTAIALLEEARLIDPDAAQTLVNLSRMHEKSEDLGNALRWAREAVRVRPDSGPAHYQLGRLHVIGQRLDDAASSLTEALRLGVEGEDKRLMYGRVLMNLGRWNDAERALAQLTNRYPGSVSGWTNLAVCQARLRRFDDAMHSLNRARALNPNAPEINQAAQHVQQIRRSGG